jgi:RNA polymerase sigma-70 factor (ECF subfamily)
MSPPPRDPDETDDAPESSADGDAPESGTPGSEADRSGSVRAQRPAVPQVNLREIPASNSKQARAKEAEEDRVLIGRAQDGDTAAFRQLVERHQRRAFAIALSLVRDENDARELVQEAFLRVHRGLASFQGGSSFFTWLYRIITNLSIDLIRKPGRELGVLDDSRHDTDETQEAEFPFISRVDGGDPADVVRRREIASRLQKALDALPSYHRGVIVMREIEGLSYEEMAQSMGVSKGTIMSRLFHARQKLQKALADCYAEQIGAPGPRDGRVSDDEADGHAAEEEEVGRA